MTIRHHFLEIKHQFFPRWDRDNLWRISTRSRRTVHGYCDAGRRVIEIVIQHTDPDKSDCLLIHEICHAVAKGGHGKVWQRRLEKAAKRADELGRDVLARLLRQEIVNYQKFAEGREQAYQTVQDWMNDEPDLTLAQVKRSIARLHGLPVSEISTKLKRIEKVYWGGEARGPGSKGVKSGVVEGGSWVMIVAVMFHTEKKSGENCEANEVNGPMASLCFWESNSCRNTFVEKDHDRRTANVCPGL